MYHRTVEEVIPSEIADQPASTSGEIELTDGSVVTLNQHSILRFPGEFEASRDVVLEGQAYFDVAKGKTPFVVSVDNSQIEVLGTEFLVSEGKHNLRVSVIEGTVSLSAEDEKIVLEAGQEGIRHNSRLTLRVENDPDPNRMSWFTNQFEFDDTPLSSVVNHLNRHFDSNVRLGNKELGKCTITGSFTDQSLSEILESISTVLDLSVQKKQNQIILKGKGC